MALGAETLPVGAIPEEAAVAAMRDDVVDDGCGPRLARVQVVGITAHGVSRKPAGAGSLPSVVVSTRGRRAAQAIVAAVAVRLDLSLEGRVVRAVDAPTLTDQAGAPGVPARPRTDRGHTSAPNQPTTWPTRSLMVRAAVAWTTAVPSAVVVITFTKFHAANASGGR